MKEALSRIKLQLPEAFKGTYGNAVKDSLIEIEARLKIIESEIPLPPRIQY
jgi:hypothetical protein